MFLKYSLDIVYQFSLKRIFASGGGREAKGTKMSVYSFQGGRNICTMF